MLCHSLNASETSMVTKGQKLVAVYVISFIAQNSKHSNIRFFRLGMFH